MSLDFLTCSSLKDKVVNSLVFSEASEYAPGTRGFVSSLNIYLPFFFSLNHLSDFSCKSLDFAVLLSCVILSSCAKSRLCFKYQLKGPNSLCLKSLAFLCLCVVHLGECWGLVSSVCSAWGVRMLLVRFCFHHHLF